MTVLYAVGNAVTNGSCLHIQDLTVLYAYMQLALKANSCLYSSPCATTVVLAAACAHSMLQCCMCSRAQASRVYTTATSCCHFSRKVLCALRLQLLSESFCIA